MSCRGQVTAPTIALALGLSCLASTALAAPVYYDAEVSIAHEENLARSQRSQDKLSDEIVILRGSANWLRTLTENSGLLGTLSVEHQQYKEWKRLSHWNLGGDVIYRLKPFTSFNAPWFDFEGAVTLREYQGSRLRDAVQTLAGASIGTNLTDRIQIKSGYQFLMDRAWSDKVFDGERHRVFANGSWQISQLTWYATVGWEKGDTTSTNTKNPALKAVAIVALPDSALSSPLFPRNTYRIDAETLTADFGVNFAITSRLALECAALYFDSENPLGFRYRGYQVTGSFLYRF